MYLSTLVIQNFRCFGSPGITLQFQAGMNVIIGENNSGKSACVDALRILFSLGPGRRELYVHPQDFHYPPTGTQSEQIALDAMFVELDEEEQAAFYELLARGVPGITLMRLTESLPGVGEGGARLAGAGRSRECDVRDTWYPSPERRRQGQGVPGAATLEARGAVQSCPEGPRMKDYHISIFYSDEDEGYLADVPDLEACSAFGRSPEEALREVESARDAWLAAARAEGKPIPEPRYRPAIYQAAS